MVDMLGAEIPSNFCKSNYVIHGSFLISSLSSSTVFGVTAVRFLPQRLSSEILDAPSLKYENHIYNVDILCAYLPKHFAKLF